jgi:PAS domain S-box-containing protein
MIIPQDASPEASFARESLRRAQVVASNSVDVFYETGQSGLIDWISPNVEDLLGWRFDQLVGRDVRSFTHADDLTRLDDARQEVYGNGSTVSRVVLRLQTVDQRYRWVSLGARRRVGARGEFLGAVAVLSDVHEHTATQRALATLSEANRELVRVVDESGLIQRMCTILVSAGGYAFAWYGRPIADAARSVRPVAHAGPHEAFLDAIQVSWGPGPSGDGPVGKCIRERQICATQVTRNSPDYGPWRRAAPESHLLSSIALPVLVDDTVDGALMVYSEEPFAFDGPAQSLLCDLAADLGYGLRRVRDTDLALCSVQNSVSLLAAAVESRDPYTAGHQRNVSSLASAIGTEMGLPTARVHGLALGGAIHDVGKIAVPHAILSKSGPLSPDEWVLLRRHTTVGWEITKSFPWKWPIAEMVHQHHERLDGSGYPQGLTGSEILQEAQIIAVADVFDAMTHTRPYRARPGEDSALRELVAGQGSRFSMSAVDAILRVIAKGALALPAVEGGVNPWQGPIGSREDE